MREAEQVSALIGEVYDAALNPALWVGVLAKCAGFVGGSAAALYSKDAVSKSGNLYDHGGGIEPYWLQLYFDKFVKLAPTTTYQFFAEVEEPIAAIDYMPWPEFMETRLYREWGRPQGLDKSARGFTAVVVFRRGRDGLVDDETRRRMRLIAPHIRRAVLIGKVIDLRTAEAATFADTLDGVSAGMILVDAYGRIVHANAAGHGMLAEGSVLSAAGQKLAAHDASAEQTLHDVFLAANSGDTAVGTKGIAVPLVAGDGDRYVAHVLPLTSGPRRRAGTSYAAATALFVHEAVLDAPSAPEVIAKAFKLTPSELRVRLAIVEVGGVPGTAEALGVAETTVKTHLRRLYAKTGTGRQAKLVKLVAGFSNPLVG